MLVTLGWMLLAGLPPTRPHAIDTRTRPPTPAAGRVAVWTDRDEPYAARRGRAGLPQRGRAIVRRRVPGRHRRPDPGPVPAGAVDRHLRARRDASLEVTGARDGRSFLVDDDPGMGYLFAIASAEPLDFRRHHPGRLLGLPPDRRRPHPGRPYVRLTDLAARLAPDGDYDYDIAPYYVDRHYDYPRFVCYDCHAYASYASGTPTAPRAPATGS